MTRSETATHKPITVALIGGDGAGKSTIAKRLTLDPTLSVRYIYMGPSLESASHLLPWSRVALRIKLARLQRRHPSDPGSAPANTHSLEEREKPSSLPRTLVRSLNQYVELLYRLGVAARYRRQGFDVVFDRHILYEISPGADAVDAATRARNRYARILHRTCPRPDATILLLASPTVMLERKGETNEAYLERRNQEWVERVKDDPTVVRVDADGEPDHVYRLVVAALTSRFGLDQQHSTDGSHPD